MKENGVAYVFLATWAEQIKGVRPLCFVLRAKSGIRGIQTPCFLPPVFCQPAGGGAIAWPAPGSLRQIGRVPERSVWIWFWIWLPSGQISQRRSRFAKIVRG